MDRFKPPRRAPAIYGHRHAKPCGVSRHVPASRKPQMDRFLMRPRIGYPPRQTRGTEGAGAASTTVHPAKAKAATRFLSAHIPTGSPSSGRRPVDRGEPRWITCWQSDPRHSGTPKCCLSGVSTRGAARADQGGQGACAGPRPEHIATPGDVKETRSGRPIIPSSDAQRVSKARAKKRSRQAGRVTHDLLEHSGSRWQ